MAARLNTNPGNPGPLVQYGMVACLYLFVLIAALVALAAPMPVERKR